MVAPLCHERQLHVPCPAIPGSLRARSFPFRSAHMHRRRSEFARKDLGMEGELPSRSPDVALEQGLRRHNIVVAQRCHARTMLIVHCPPRAVVHETRVYATVGLRTIPEPMNEVCEPNRADTFIGAKMKGAIQIQKDLWIVGSGH